MCELAAVARAITRSSFATRRVSAWAFVIGCCWGIAPTLLEGAECVNSGRFMNSEGWIDVQIRTAVDAAELLGVLADPVIQGGWEEQGVVHLYWPKPQWSVEARARLNSVLQASIRTPWSKETSVLRNCPIRIGIGSGLNRSDRFESAGGL